jgi:hypothetical protein
MSLFGLFDNNSWQTINIATPELYEHQGMVYANKKYAREYRHVFFMYFVSIQHTHSRFIPEGVANILEIFRDIQILPK